MNHKLLVLLLYYNRPVMVRETLKSILKANETYQNWEVAFIDDGSPIPGEPVVREIVPPELLSNFRFYRYDEGVEAKLARGGLSGEWANAAMLNSDADLCIFLCDDDLIYPGYFSNLDGYFTSRPEVNWCYSHIIDFDPVLEDPDDGKNRRHWLNHRGALDPPAKVDASQVCWRLTAVRDGRAKLPANCGSALDLAMFGSLLPHYGPCHFSGFFSQYKSNNYGGLMSTSVTDIWTGKASSDIDEHRHRLNHQKCVTVLDAHLSGGDYRIAEKIVARAKQFKPDEPWIKDLENRLVRHEALRHYHKEYFLSAFWGGVTYGGLVCNKSPSDLWMYQEIITRNKEGCVVVQLGFGHGGMSLFLADTVNRVGEGVVIVGDSRPFPAAHTHPRLVNVAGERDAVVAAAAAYQMPVVVIIDAACNVEEAGQHLSSYHDMVTPGSYLIVEWTNVEFWEISRDKAGITTAIRSFLATHPEFSIDRGCEKYRMTFNPCGYLRRDG